MIIPEHWHEMLRRMQEDGFPEAIIAGGALRDLDHNVSAKDVDIFVRKPDNVEGSIKAMVEKAVELPVAKVVIDFEDGTGVGDDTETYDLHEMGCYAIYQFQFGGTIFEIIVIAGADKHFAKWVIDDFDIGLCCAYYTGHASIDVNEADVVIEGPVFTEAYERDRVMKTLTILKAPTDKALARTRKRSERLLVKYPGYKVVEGWYSNEVTE